ncbi:MAG: PASTA domain-containing protein, partial [Clostridia bacterium]|nr:PASTA domain-containing protein [Clostridia bacterium]
DKGNVVKSFDYEPDRQVVSESTCDSILKILTNSTKNASVSGYNIVSKTGTSEKRDTVDNLDDFISSCVSFAPAEDPKIAILVTVDEPTGSSHFGSAVAAPVVSKILTEILPHLGILPKQDEVRTVTLSDYRNSKVSDAKSVIERLGLKCVVKGDGSIVVDQMPRFDTVIEGDGVVILYTEGETPEADVKVPKLIGSTPTAAIKSLINSNLNVSITGIFNNDYKNCYVVAQSVQAGTYVAPGTVIELTFRYEESIE